jgi:replicative DNA helicase
VPTAANAGYYAEIVHERAVLRRLVEAGTRIVQMGYAQGEGDIDDIVNRAQAEVYNVAEKRGGEDYRVLGEILDETLTEIEAASGRTDEMTGVPTGFLELDELTNGLHPGQMIVVAARPAVGKSTLGIDIARAAAIKHQMATAIFSLEMSRTEITMRILSAEATIQLQDLRKGLKSQDQWNKLARIMGKISDSPLFIDDSPNLSLMEIRAKCRRLKQQHNLKMVIIDYLQLMSSGKKVESRQQEVAEFSRALKLLAKELEVPVIAISQLNRGPEQRTDKRPQMSDLRESGSIEQDADVVILLHRDRSDPERDGEADVIVAKHRNGPTKDIVLAFQRSTRYPARQISHANSGTTSTGSTPVSPNSTARFKPPTSAAPTSPSTGMKRGTSRVRSSRVASTAAFTGFTSPGPTRNVQSWTRCSPETTSGARPGAAVVAGWATAGRIATTPTRMTPASRVRRAT